MYGTAAYPYPMIGLRRDAARAIFQMSNRTVTVGSMPEYWSSQAPDSTDSVMVVSATRSLMKPGAHNGLAARTMRKMTMALLLVR